MSKQRRYRLNLAKYLALLVIAICGSSCKTNSPKNDNSEINVKLLLPPLLRVQSIRGKINEANITGEPLLNATFDVPSEEWADLYQALSDCKQHDSSDDMMGKGEIHIATEDGAMTRVLILQSPQQVFYSVHRDGDSVLFAGGSGERVWTALIRSLERAGDNTE